MKYCCKIGTLFLTGIKLNDGIVGIIEYFIFRLEYLTGVYDKSLFLASNTPDERLKWVTRIQNYTKDQQLDQAKLKEYQSLKDIIAEQVSDSHLRWVIVYIYFRQF